MIKSTTIGVLALLATAPLARAQTAPVFEHLQGGRAEAITTLQVGAAVHVWIAEDARIRYSEDGGATWDFGDVPPTVYGQVRDIQFLDELNGWAVADGGHVLRSTDGGVNWAIANDDVLLDMTNDPQPASPWTIHMFDGLNGWIGGDDGVLYSTTSGGQFWSAPAITNDWAGLEDPPDFYDIAWLDQPGGGSVGLVSGDWGLVIRTTDGGVTWALAGVDTASSCPSIDGHGGYLELWGISFWDHEKGVAAGGIGLQQGFLFRTEDAGLTWTQETCLKPLDPAVVIASDAIPTLYDVVALPNGKAMAVGYASNVYVLEPGGAMGTQYDACLNAMVPATGEPCWVQTPHVPTEFGGKAPLHGAAALNASAVWVCGLFDVIRASSNGGYAWTEQGGTNLLRLQDGDFVSGSVGCVIGQGRVVKRTDSSGVDWDTVYPLPPATPDFGQLGIGISLSSTGSGVAIGLPDFVARSTNDGASWTEVPAALPGSPSLRDVAFAPGTNAVVVVGAAGYAARSVNGGATWTAVPVPTSETLNAVAFSDADTGYAVGTNQAAFFTDDGGASWSAVPISGGVAGAHFLGVATSDDGSLAMAVGTNGLVYSKPGIKFIRTDLGAAAVDVDLLDVAILGGGTEALVCGQLGTLLHSSTTSGWTRLQSHTTIDVHALSRVASDRVFGIGQTFLVLDGQ
jgi:photosystem II stability/assembly factor-like uncharacterized protein